MSNQNESSQPVSSLALSPAALDWLKVHDFQSITDIQCLTEVELFMVSPDHALAKEVIEAMKSKDLPMGLYMENPRQRKPPVVAAPAPAEREPRLTFVHSETRPLTEVLTSLRASINEIYPAAIESLAVAATNQEIEQLQGTLDLPLPDNLRTLLEFANGQNDDADVHVSFFPFQFNLLAVNQIIADYNMHADLKQNSQNTELYEIKGRSGKILDVTYHDHWIPFANIDRNTLHMDMAPGDEGTPGQIIVSGHGTKYLSKNLAAFLGQYEAGLLAGWYFALPARNTFDSKGLIW